jgi:signal transduction histidine kinase
MKCHILPGILLLFLVTDAQALENVVLQLRWDHQFQFAGYYAAQWQGYYQEAGFAVEIRSAITPEGRIISATQEVAQGRADFGVGAADILIARDQGIPLVVLASIFQQSAAGFYANEETQLQSPADLLNLRVARRVNDLIDVELQAMLLSEGIDPQKVTPYPHESGVEHFVSGRVDVIPGYRITLPYTLAQKGIRFKVLRPISYGIDFYGDSLFTLRSRIDRDPEEVQRFVQATLKGWMYALSHADQIADRIADELPRNDKSVSGNLREYNRFQIDGVISLALFGVVETGHVNANRWFHMYQLMRGIGILKNPLNMDDLVFDPEKLRREKEARMFVILRSFFYGLIGMTLLILIWSFMLRRMVKQKVIQLREVNQKLDQDNVALRKMETLLRQSENQYRLLNVDLEARIHERTAQLEVANQELEAFAYSVSHDLKAPLRGIDGYSRLLLDEYAACLNDEGRAFVHNIRQGTQRMATLINDLLAYSRMERRALHCDLLDLRALLAGIVADYAAEIERQGATVRLALPPTLQVCADLDGLRQALRNLLDNALKFGRAGVPVEVEMGGQVDEGVVTLWVKDNGIGIDPRFHERIFEIFQRLQRAEDYPGTGIGLAIVRKALQRMGGRVWIESAAGQGTIFFLELPA